MEKDEGRPMSVYGWWRPKAFEHDVLGVTEFALAYRNFEWIRGNELDRNSDGIMFIDEEKLYVEVERKMPSGRIRDKLAGRSHQISPENCRFTRRPTRFPTITEWLFHIISSDNLQFGGETSISPCSNVTVPRRFDADKQPRSDLSAWPRKRRLTSWHLWLGGAPLPGADPGVRCFRTRALPCS